MIVEINGQQYEVPDDATQVELDGELYDIDAGTEDIGHDDGTEELRREIEQLKHEMGILPQHDIEYINHGLAELEQQIGRALTPDEAQALGELAAQQRDADGNPDLSVMAEGLALRESIDEAITEYAIPPEQADQFVTQALQDADDGGPDFQGAYEALYDLDVASEPQRPAPDASPEEHREYLMQRAAELDRASQVDRQVQAAERASKIEQGEDPGPAERGMQPWEIEGRPPDMDDEGERVAAMTEQLQALNETPPGTPAEAA